MAKAPTAAELKQIFDAVKPLISPYAKGSVVARVDFDIRYELYSELDLVDQLGKARKEVMFAAAIVQGRHMGFYFMPIYSHPELVERIGPSLRKTLKGKSCFNLTRWDATLAAEAKALLKEGHALYRSLGWIK